MAVGDSISWAGSTYNYSMIYITPASGDEWVIKMLGGYGHYSYGAWIWMTPDGGTTWLEMWSSEKDRTTVIQNFLGNDLVAGREIYWFISPTVRIKFTGVSGSSPWWYMGVKTKD